MMITNQHYPSDIPADVAAILDQVREWKQNLTKTYGPGQPLRPEISMFDSEVNFLGDVEFPHPFIKYDLMGISLGLCGLVMAFDVRFFAFYTEAFMLTTSLDAERREDGSYAAPTMEEIHRRFDPENDMTPEEAWLAGDDSIQPSLLVIVADTLAGRTWSVTLGFKYELGNNVQWFVPDGDRSQGPDYRSLMYGTLLLPAVVRSQYDYLRIRPEPKEAMEYLFAQGCTISLTEGTALFDSLADAGVHLVSHDEVSAIYQEQEDLISREVEGIPDAPPEDWLDGE